jgi:hypothetical protein
MVGSIFVGEAGIPIRYVQCGAGVKRLAAKEKSAHIVCAQDLLISISKRKIMGRQIIFYTDDQFDAEFIKYALFLKLEILFDNLPEIKTITNFNEYNIYKQNGSCYFYKKEFGRLYFNTYSNRKCIDQITSSCIQFVQTSRSEKEKFVDSGRIWYPTSYWNKNNELVKIQGEIEIYYKKLYKWLKKNLEKIILPHKQGNIQDYGSQSVLNYIKDGYFFR